MSKIKKFKELNENILPPSKQLEDEAYDILDGFIHDAFAELQNQYDITVGDIPPDVSVKLEKSKEEISKIMAWQITWLAGPHRQP